MVTDLRVMTVRTCAAFEDNGTRHYPGHIERVDRVTASRWIANGWAMIFDRLESAMVRPADEAMIMNQAIARGNGRCVYR